MLVKLVSPAGKVQNIRETDVQYYLSEGYKRVAESVQESETVEMMSPAGKIVIMKKDVDDYLNREGWSLLEPEIPAEDEKPEPSAEDEKPEESETPVEDEIPAEKSEPGMVEADTEATNDIPEGAEEADAEMEG